MSDSVGVRVVSGEERVMAEGAEASAAARAHSLAYFLQIGHEGGGTFILHGFLLVFSWSLD